MTLLTPLHIDPSGVPSNDDLGEPVRSIMEVLEAPPMPELTADSGARCAQLAARAVRPSTVTDLFFSARPADIRRACQICLQCPVRELCYRSAVARQEGWGVWGGRLFENGKVVAVKRRRGRPRKAGPHPDDIFVGVVDGTTG